MDILKGYTLPDSWDNTTKLSFLQRRVIVHSILYYEMSESIISDIQFDTISRQLVALMRTASREECEKSQYWYVMSNFDASTGFYIYDKLSTYDRARLHGIACWVLDQYKKRCSNETGNGVAD